MDIDLEKTIKLGSPSFLLYHHPHSLASLTARFCIEIGKAAHPNAKAHIIQIEVVLDEHGNLPPQYLNTNSSGAIPALIRQKPETAISSSIDIVDYFAQRDFPSLIPTAHKTDIEPLLRNREIFEQDILLLTYSRTPFESYPMIGDIVSEVREQSFSGKYEYQVALPKKLKLNRDNIHDAFVFLELHKAEDRIKSWLTALYMIRMRHKKAGSIWLFGTKHGTAVDAHAAVLIHRLLDITRPEMMPSELLWWALTIFQSPMWQQITKGKDTMGWDGKESLKDKMAVADTGIATEEDDGWAPIWEESAQAFCFYNRFTGATQWINSRVPEASQPPPPGVAAASEGPEGGMDGSKKQKETTGRTRVSQLDRMPKLDLKGKGRAE